MQQAVFTLHTLNCGYIKTLFLPPVAALLHYFLVVVQSAPVSSSNLSPAFTQASNRAKMLVEKILRDIPTVHGATVSTEVNKISDWLLQLVSYWLFFFFMCY